MRGLPGGIRGLPGGIRGLPCGIGGLPCCIGMAPSDGAFLLSLFPARPKTVCYFERQKSLTLV